MLLLLYIMYLKMYMSCFKFIQLCIRRIANVILTFVFLSNSLTSPHICESL
uniref:Uncharacterized protein n=1 Tax=Papilio xuthus TaxID=66420 RepID=I4DQL4_PAPXU|nr:unknown unsecreted protein [Papilio xuthus]